MATQNNNSDTNADLETILASIEDAVVSRDQDLRVVYFNEKFNQTTEQLLGQKAFVGMNTLDYVPEEVKNYWTGILEGSKG